MVFREGLQSTINKANYSGVDAVVFNNGVILSSRVACNVIELLYSSKIQADKSSEWMYIMHNSDLDIAFIDEYNIGANYHCGFVYEEQLLSKLIKRVNILNTLDNLRISVIEINDTVLFKRYGR